MELRTIFEDNIDEYSGQIDQDVAENMGRMYYHGIAVHDPEDHNLLSLLIWKLKFMENGRDHE